MLFCPICEIYDCGIHIDDSSTFGHSHHYVHPVNITSNQDLTQSALNLLQ